MAALLRPALLRSALALVLSLGLLTPALADEILVAAAASLSNAFKDLAREFEALHPETRVLTTFGASDVVLRQILEGAPVDVFVAADPGAMDQAQAAQAIAPETRRDFARNALVLIVPRQGALDIQALADLRAPSIRRIALGNPRSVPAGRYALAALQQAGLDEQVAQRQVLGQNVRQVLSYVAQGEVAAGFVFATDAALAPDTVRVVQTVATPTPVVYPMARVAGSASPGAADAFLNFVDSDAGQAILARYGFSPP